MGHFQYRTNCEEVHKNVLSEGCQALVLYGEPQSGKTETMIALTAKFWIWKTYSSTKLPIMSNLETKT